VGLIWQGIKQTSFEWETFQPKQTNSPMPSIGSNVLGVDEASNAANINNLVQVIKVVDGDTIDVLINGQKQTVRLIGINTPETVDPRRPVQCFGKEASNETKRLLEGKQVYLTKDVSETDKYNRILRLVYLPLENGQMLFVNDYLVRQGFASNYTYPPDIKFDSQFRQAEKEARDNNRGLWSKCH
jgi:micrococcal nuclease